MSEVVRASLEKFIKPFKVVVPQDIFIKGKRVYLASKELQAFVTSTPIDAFSLGLPLGELTSKGFAPSLALLDLLKETENKIVIKDDAEWLFTCGRDVFKDKVIKNPEAKLKEPFLVENKRGEVLGLGKFDKSDKKGTVLNVLDRGDFLRREEKRKKVKR